MGKWTGTQTGTQSLAAFFWEAGSFASAIPQVIELRAPYMCVTDDIHFVDPRRAEQEGALHSDAVRGDAAYREIRIVAALAQADDRSAKLLHAFAITLADAQMNAHIVPRIQFGDIFVRGRFESLQQFRH